MTQGVIYTYTVIHSAAEAFKDKIPYAVALVEQDGKLVMARIEGYDASKIIDVGTVVELAGQDSGGNSIYKFIS